MEQVSRIDRQLMVLDLAMITLLDSARKTATVTIDTLARFRAFIEATKVLLPSVDEKTHASEEATLQAFKDFIELATPLLLKDIRQCLVDHRTELDHLASWLIPSGHDPSLGHRSGWLRRSIHRTDRLDAPPARPAEGGPPLPAGVVGESRD
jgi:hypothetical protein